MRLPSCKQDTTLRLSEPRLCAVLYSTPDLLFRNFLPCKTKISSFQQDQLTLFCQCWPAGGGVGGNHSLKDKPGWSGDWCVVSGTGALFVQLLVCLHCAHQGHIFFIEKSVLSRQSRHSITAKLFEKLPLLCLKFFFFSHNQNFWSTGSQLTGINNPP